MLSDNLNRRQLLRQSGLLAGCALLAGCTERPTPIPPGTRIAYGENPLQFGDLRLPPGEGPHPVVVVIHGGYWQARYGLDLMDAIAAALTADGWATWNVEYRRLGDAGGGWPGTFQDVAQATDHLRTLAGAHRLDLERVTALGHSAGGHLALWLAARPRIAPQAPLHSTDPIAIAQVISLAGVADLRQAWELRLGGGIVHALLGGTPEEVPERYACASPAALLPFGPKVRQVLVHGDQDMAVPLVVSQTYRKTAEAKGDEVTLIELLHVGHFEIIDPKDRVWEKIRASLRHNH